MAAPRIVVVDHDETFLRLMQQILATEGYRTRTIGSSTGAYELVVAEQPDLVIQESWLEDKEAGWMLLQKFLLDERTSQVPLLFISSDPADLRQRAESLEGLPHVRTMTKPFTPDMLLAIVREMVGPGPSGET